MVMMSLYPESAPSHHHQSSEPTGGGGGSAYLGAMGNGAGGGDKGEDDFPVPSVWRMLIF